MDSFTDTIFVSFIFRINCNSNISKKGFRAGSGNDNVVVGTHYTTKVENTESFSGDEYYVVDGKEYSLITEGTDLPSEGTVTAGDIFNQSDIKVDPDFAIIIAALPASEDGMKIEKTYAAAESAFDNVVMDAVGDDLLKLILIIVGVVIGVLVLIVVVIVVIILLKKKKKNQQQM